MTDVKNLTVEAYISQIDVWFQEHQEKPISNWSVFGRARRWLW